MTPTDYFDYDCATTIKEATPEDLDAADLEMMQQLINHASHTMALRIEFLERELHRATQAIATLMADGERQANRALDAGVDQ